MKRSIIAAFLGIFTGFFLLRLLPHEPHVERSAQTKAQDDERGVQPAITINENANTGRESLLRKSFAPAESSDAFFDPGLLSSNTVYKARVLKHIDIKYYEASFAKSTPECEAIRALLAKEGVGRDAVGDAYNAAWDYARAVEIARKSGQNDEVVTQMVREGGEDRLKKKYGITNALFFDSLFNISPQVFFGKKNLALPQPGEQLLDQ